MLHAVWQKNDRKARWVILVFSAIVFSAIMLLSRVKWNVNLGFDVHLFAKANALINTVVAVLLIVALIAVKAKNYVLHRNIMLTAMFLSVLFLLSYICHHLFAGETRFGDMIITGS
jgi:putative membrane protein